MKYHLLGVCCVSVILGTMVGCAGISRSPFPETVERQITPEIHFTQVVQDPQGYLGKILKVGGEVLSAKRYPDRTEIVILQLPLADDSSPDFNRMNSEGRFVATQEAFLDPATIPAKTRVTVIGEVTGSHTIHVDEQEKAYPVLEVKALHVWPMIPPGYYGYPPPYWWGPSPYWGGYWGPSPYWAPYYYWGVPRASYWYGRRHSGFHRKRK